MPAGQLPLLVAIVLAALLVAQLLALGTWIVAKRMRASTSAPRRRPRMARTAALDEANPRPSD